MDWEDGVFNAMGRPVFGGPKGDDSNKRIELGGLDTRAWLIHPQPNELPAFTVEAPVPEQAAGPKAASIFEFGPSGVRATSAGDPFADHMFSPLKSPPAPGQEGPKRLRSESSDKAPGPKAAKTASASRGASSTERPQWSDPAAAHARAELLRVKARPPAAPENIQEAAAEARARN